MLAAARRHWVVVVLALAVEVAAAIHLALVTTGPLPTGTTPGPVSTAILTAALVSGPAVLLADPVPVPVLLLLAAQLAPQAVVGCYTATHLAAIIVTGILAAGRHWRLTAVLGAYWAGGCLIVPLIRHPQTVSLPATLAMVAIIAMMLGLMAGQWATARFHAYMDHQMVKRAQSAYISRALYDTLAHDGTRMIMQIRDVMARQAGRGDAGEGTTSADTSLDASDDAGPDASDDTGPDAYADAGLDAFAEAFDAYDNASLASVLESAADEGCEAVADLQAMLYLTKRGSTVPPLPEPDLEQALSRARRTLTHMGLKCEVVVDGDISTVPPLIASALVRAVDESVTNMTKYAAAEKPCTFMVEVTDNAAGIMTVNTIRATDPFDRRAMSSGLGMVGLQEHVAVVGGDMVQSTDRGMWVLALLIPLSQADLTPASPDLDAPAAPGAMTQDETAAEGRPVSPAEPAGDTVPQDGGAPPPQEEADGGQEEPVPQEGPDGGQEEPVPQEEPDDGRDPEPQGRRHLLGRLRLPRIPSVLGRPRIRNYAPWMVSGATTIMHLPAAIFFEDPYFLATSLGAGLALLLLRRLPWILTPVLIVGSALSRAYVAFLPFWLAAGLAPLILLSVRKVRQTYMVVIAQLLVACAELWLKPEFTLRIVVIYAVVLALSVGGGLSLYLPQRRLDRLTEELRNRIRCQRQATARRIHDGLARHMTHMLLFAQRARDMIDDSEDPDSIAILDTVIDTGTQCLQRLREAMRTLKDDGTDLTHLTSARHRTPPREPLPWPPVRLLTWPEPPGPFIEDPQWPPLHSADSDG